MSIVTTKKPHKQPKKANLAGQTFEVLGRLQAAVRAVIEATPGMTRRPADLQRTLGLPKKLAWQVHRFAHTEDVLAEVALVPGTTAMERFLDASLHRGAPMAVVELVRSELTALESLIESNAGSRSEFESIASGLSRNGSEQMDLTHKRAAFKAQCHIWGSLTQARLSSYVVHPVSDGKADALAIIGNIGHCRLHGDRPYVVSQTVKIGGFGDTVGHPLENDITNPGSSILKEFSTKPFPIHRNYVDPTGRLTVEISPADFGRSHAITSFVAERYASSVGRFRTDNDSMFNVSSHIRMPISVWIGDFVIAEGTFGSETPLPQAYMVGRFDRECERFESLSEYDEDKDILDRPEVIYLGKGSKVLNTPDVPRYSEMFEYVCSQLGWDHRVFQVFRCRVEYPVLPSTIGMAFDLPERPEPPEQAGAE